MLNQKNNTAAILIAAAVSACVLSPLCADSSLAASKHFYKGTVSATVMNADRLMMKGKYADAATFYQSALKKNPKDINANIGYGMALTKQFKIDGADDQFNKALAKDPGNPGALAGKALNALNRLQSSSATIRNAKDSILKQAEADAQKAIDSDTRMPEAYYAMGMVLKEEGRLPEAAAQMQKAIDMDPKFADGFSGLGMIQLAQNNNAGAQSNFNKAIKVNTGDWTAHYGLGQSLLNQGKTDAALKELNTAQYQFPNSWPVRLALGTAYANQGNTVAAVQQYQASIAIKPENAAAYLGIANVREGRGDLELSIAELRSGLELMPNNPDLNQRIGDQSLRVDKIDDAIKAYQNALNAQPGNSKAADGLTNAFYLKAQKETTGSYFGDNDFDSGLAMIDKAVQMNPNDIKLRLAQAKMRALAGDDVDLSKIGVPSNDGERISYAQALLAQNKFSEADQQIKMVLANTKDPKQTFALADMSLMMHDLDNAQAAYQKAASMSGGAQRGQRGLTQVSKARVEARKSLTLASDEASRKMRGSAVDQFHEAVGLNPKSADARLGLAKALEDVKSPTPVQLRESAVQMRAYVALSPTLPAKEQEKWLAKADKLDNKAGKRERKELARQGEAAPASH